MERRLRGQFVCCDAGWQSADRPPAGSDGARLCPAERDQPSHFPASRAQGNDQAPPPFVAAAAGPMDTAALRGRAGSRRSLRPRSGRSTATGPRVQTPRAHGGGGRSADSLSAVSPTGSRQRVRPQVANLRHGRAPLCATSPAAPERRTPVRPGPVWKPALLQAAKWSHNRHGATRAIASRSRRRRA
jgi:hypothetical protein